jgi:hypothetical protein
MVEQPPSDTIPYRKVFEALSAIAGILALPYAVSLPLRDFRWVENQYSAGIMILVAILASLLFLAGAEAFQRWLKVPGLSSNGGRGYVAIAIGAVTFTCFGFFGHYLIGQSTSEKPALKKPAIIKFEPMQSSAKLDFPELIAYRNYLTSVPDRFYPMIDTVPYSQPTAAHYFTVGPGESIDTAFAFLVPGDKTESIRILKIGREKTGGSDISIAVPEASAGDRVLLLLRTNRDVNLYPGEVQ